MAQRAGIQKYFLWFRIMQPRLVDHMEFWICCLWEADTGANGQSMPGNQGTQRSCHQACLGFLGMSCKLDHHSKL